MLNLAIIVGLSAAVALLVVRNRYLSVNATMYQELYEDQVNHSDYLYECTRALESNVSELSRKLEAFPVRGKNGKFATKAAN